MSYSSNPANNLAAFRLKKAMEQEAEAALERKAFEEGDILPCGCCFDDVPSAKTTHCDSETPHFFCLDCAKGNVNATLEKQQYQFHCMDISGCKADFSRSERVKFIDEDSMATLDRIQAKAVLREANIPDMESCPFCTFEAIVDPIKVDKEFRCEHPHCRVVSCRICKMVSHTPKSCEEHKKDMGLNERHLMEEKMTEAALRRCPRCSIPIVKDGGCNKLICSQCRCYVCDVCGKDISVEGYKHFNGQTGCTQSDNGQQRVQQRVQQAEREAKEKIRNENPDITDADLEIRFSAAVKTNSTQQAPPRGNYQGGHLGNGGIFVPRNEPAMAAEIEQHRGLVRDAVRRAEAAGNATQANLTPDYLEVMRVNENIRRAHQAIRRRNLTEEGKQAGTLAANNPVGQNAAISGIGNPAPQGRSPTNGSMPPQRDPLEGGPVQDPRTPFNQDPAAAAFFRDPRRALNFTTTVEYDRYVRTHVYPPAYAPGPNMAPNPFQQQYAPYGYSLQNGLPPIPNNNFGVANRNVEPNLVPQPDVPYGYGLYHRRPPAPAPVNNNFNSSNRNVEPGIEPSPIPQQAAYNPGRQGWM